MLNKKGKEFHQFDLKGKTILIADDDYMVRFYYQEAYSDTGVMLLVAEDVKEVVELFKSHPEIDLVLMDARMPEQSGYEATKHILSINSKAVILMQSASVLPEDRELALSIGCIDYLEKPVNPEMLIEVLSSK